MNDLLLSPNWKPRVVELVLPQFVPELLRLCRLRNVPNVVRSRLQEFAFMYYDVDEYAFVVGALVGWRDSLSNELLKSYLVDGSFSEVVNIRRVRHSLVFPTLIVDEKVLSFIEQSSVFDNFSVGEIDGLRNDAMLLHFEIGSLRSLIGRHRVELSKCRKLGNRVRSEYFADLIVDDKVKLDGLCVEYDMLRSRIRVLRNIFLDSGHPDVKSFIVASLRKLFARQSSDFVSLDDYLSKKARYYLDNADYYERELCDKCGYIINVEVKS